ncbi:multivesicular body subunit 12A, partial [Silurus asotus]
RPISAICWASNTSTCPASFTMIFSTEDGAAANFTRGFGLKAGYFLCYSKDLSGGTVVSDVQVISEKDAIPPGFCFIPEFIESKSSVWKKKRVCVRIVPLHSVTSAILDIRLTAKSKMMLPQYTCLGDILGYVLWCLKGTFTSPAPQAKPRSLSLDMRQLSLEAATPLPLRPNNQSSQSQPKISRRRSNLDHMNHTPEVVNDGSSSHGITAMDGVPFALHPRFESRAIEKVSVTDLENIRIKSLQDIENEYNYTFTIEEKAATRLHP